LKGCDDLNNQHKGIIVGALLADSFALGPHWIYDTSVIAKHFEGMDSLMKPLAPYHKGKKAGAFTHYGDQTLHLLKTLVAAGKFDIANYKQAWLSYVGQSAMYMDHATKESIDLLKGDSLIGSSSDELGGLVRGAALYYLEDYSLTDFISQNQLTHNNPLVLTVVEFYYLVIEAILEGLSPSKAIQAVSSKLDNKVIDEAIKQAQALVDIEATKAIGSLGQSCSSKYGLPSSLYLILKYEGDYMGAMKANVMSGGDSASRGMVVGMVLGAQLGFEDLPQYLVNQLEESLPI